MQTKVHETSGDTQERAILVSLTGGRENEVRDEMSLAELERLAYTAGVEVLGTIRQNKDKPDTKWFIGKGKVDEVREEITQHGANTVIFDQELSGVQVRNLEQALDAKIIDRTQLILDIFAQRARSREGILQVELAQLSYLLPRLAGQGKNLSRLGGGIGTRGPGETKLETDRRHIRGRITELKEQLAEVNRHRKLHRERRKKVGVFQVALVGYTNAGKSTMLRELTRSEEVFVEDKLFATLDPLSRALKLPGGKEIVVVDTVGFIQQLPHTLVAAFRSTLDEVNEADLLLHVVDSSSPLREEQMKVVDKVLAELGAEAKERITIFNKMDECPPEEAELLTDRYEYIKLSAFERKDLELLMKRIEARLSGGQFTYRIPAERGDLIALVYRVGDVIDARADDEFMIYQVMTDKKEYDSMGYRIAQYEVESTGAHT
jgi:GTP-binding protein HflX